MSVVSGNTKTLRVSEMAEKLIGSEIIKLGGEIKAMMAAGKPVFNYTIGDFDPNIFPIPELLKTEIKDAIDRNETNYPAANGIAELRKSVAAFMQHYGTFPCNSENLLIAGGARPLIYAAYETLVDPGDTVVFPVPSWNNNHYTHLSRGNAVFVPTSAQNHFMPTAEELKPHLKGATLLALCSPLNPTGTVFSRQQLLDVCKLVLEENQSRSEHDKPLYLLYDQIYWMLCFGGTEHFHPVQLMPEMEPYTIYVDGISKSFAATGVRVGWAFGPQRVIDKMKSILGHVGAWSPKAEQVAVARYLNQTENVDAFLTSFKDSLYQRLQGFYEGLMSLKDKGLGVDAIAPQGAIYLTVQFNLIGKTTPQGETLNTTEQVGAYLLDKAQLAIVPFYAFGTERTSSWFRLSVGTAKLSDIAEVTTKLETALNQLK
jgi:aspartate aminotransferase